MKTKTKRIILAILVGSMALGAVAGGILAAIRSNVRALDVDAASSAPSKTYINHDAATYYSGIDDKKSGTELLKDLRTLNLSKRQSTVGYSSMGTSPSGMFKYTDYDPDTVQYDSKNQPYGTRILSFYSGISTTSWNREHVWPNSRGGGSGGSAGSPYVDADIYMPRPTISSENSNRGNSCYVEGMSHQSNGWDPVEAFGSKDCYQGEGIRGECARIIFYCMTVNSSLQLVDNADTSNSSRTKMGKLSDLLKWNLNYSVNERERNRNEGAEYLQGNRNAFVDHPEYACKIWGNTNEATKKICGQQPVEKTLTSIVISGKLNKSDYIEGDTFDPSGLTVTANYSDLTEKDVTSSESLSWEPSILKKDTESVTASYIENGIKKTAVFSDFTVKAKVVNVESVSLNANELTLLVDETATLVPTVLPEDATNKKVSFATNNASIATVSASGLVKGISKGTAKITVTTDDGKKTDICNVTVADSKIAVTGIEINPTNIEGEVGEARIISASVLPKNATNKSITWKSLNPSIASVNTEGFVYFNKAGSTTITATTVDGNFSATCNVTVNESSYVPVQSMDFDDKKLSLSVGDSYELKPKVLPENASNKGAIFESSNENVVLINEDTGILSAVGVGTATITATSLDNESIFATIEINVVSAAKLMEIEIAQKPDKTIFKVGEETDLSGMRVEGHYADGSIKIVEPVEVSDIDINTPGIKQITVSFTSENVTKSTILEVLYESKKPSGLEIESKPYKLEYYQEQDINLYGLKVNAVYSDNSKLDVTSVLKVKVNDYSATAKVVSLHYGDLSTSFPITIKEGVPNTVEKASDYTLVFAEKLENFSTPNEVTTDSWESLEFKYNQLDSSTKEYFKNLKVEQNNNEVSADSTPENITKIVQTYDEIIIKRSSDGFKDFMNRNPSSKSTAKDFGWIKTLLIVLFSSMIGIALIVIVIRTIKKQ